VVKTNPVKTQAIWDWTTPKKIKEIQCFLEFCNFYRRFIEAFSRTARPLYARTEKKCIGNWEWGDKEQKAFDELRTKRSIAPVLAYFYPLAPTEIETDASKYVSSGILFQQCKEGKWRPLAYQSKTMSDAECNYDIHNKERLAIVEAFHKWKHYTSGSLKTGTSPKGPQELSDLHDDEGTKHTTSTMDTRIKSIQLPNRIPARERRGKARRPQKPGGRPTHRRRQETHVKCGDLIAQRTILGYPRG